MDSFIDGKFFVEGKFFIKVCSRRPEVNKYDMKIDDLFIEN